MAIDAYRYAFDANSDVTFSSNSDGAAVSKYDAVKLTGEMQVEPTDTVAEDVYGVAVKGGDAGDDVGVAVHGAKPANVTNPDGAVAAGDVLTASGTAGTLRPINPGGATGESAQADGVFKALTDEDDDGHALVHIR